MNSPVFIFLIRVPFILQGHLEVINHLIVDKLILFVNSFVLNMLQVGNFSINCLAQFIYHFYFYSLYNIFYYLLKEYAFSHLIKDICEILNPFKVLLLLQQFQKRISGEKAFSLQFVFKSINNALVDCIFINLLSFEINFPLKIGYLLLC